MESAFKITPTPPTSLKLVVGELGTFSFTVTSLAAPDVSQEVVAQAMLVGPGGRRKVDWAVAQQPSLTIAGGASETVTIRVRPGASTPPGEHAIVLAIADKTELNDQVAYSAQVTCEVVATVPPPVPGKSPPWLIPLVAVCVIALGGAAFALWRVFRLAGVLDQTRTGLSKVETGVGELRSGLGKVETGVGELRAGQMRVETGTISLGATDPAPLGSCTGQRGVISGKVAFATRFASPPSVMIGLTHIDHYASQNLRLHSVVAGVDPAGFTYHFVTWCDTRIAESQVMWAAIGQK